ncbi:MAG: hypothetical protein ACLGIT_13790 [Gammaproteobacteria bacterium]
MVHRIRPRASSRLLHPLVVAAGIACGEAAALAVGAPRSPLPLGRALNLSVPVQLADGETLEPACVGAELSVGERRLIRDQVAIEVVPAGGSQVRVRLRTGLAIDEPVVELRLSLGCPARHVRHYVLFTEPPPRRADAGERPDLRTEPVAALPPAAAGAPPVVTAAAAATPPRPPARATRPPSRATNAAKPARATTVAEKIRPKSTPTARSRPPRNAVARVQPRLQVDVLEPSTATLAALARADAAEAALNDARAAAAQAAQRLASLEAAAGAARVARADADRAALAQARRDLARVESRSALWPWLVAALAASTAFGFALAWRSRRGLRTPWWSAGDAADPALAPPPVAAPHDEGDVATAAASAAEPPEPPPMAAAPPRPVAARATGVNTLQTAATRHAPALPRLSFDEQVDLEQQVEFLIVLGQEASAVQLLRAQMRRTAGHAPMPYLKLLEIHRALGDRDAYEHTARQFAARFCVRVPAWRDGAAAAPASVDDATLVSLQAVWHDPARAAQRLAERLLRPHGVDIDLDRADGAAHADDFDLPAFEDLLLLYQVADDLARHADDDAPARVAAARADAPVHAVRADELALAVHSAS